MGRCRSHHIKVLSKKWTVTFWHPDAYQHTIAQDSKAEVDADERTLDVDLSHISPELLRHELTHAYAKERSLVETNITDPDQVEEFFCEIVAKHGPTIVRQAGRLARLGGGINWKTDL